MFRGDLLRVIRGGIVAYAAAAILCLGILVLVMQLWDADVAIPFGPQYGDNLFYGMLTKSLLDNGWYLHNRYLGAPEGLDLHDFPIADTLHVLLMKLIALLTPNYATVLNVYFMLTFPLTTVTSLFVFRQLKLSYPTSVVGSLLFTFLPYHFFRGEMHIFLAGYYLVPLMVQVILWTGMGKDSLPKETCGVGQADEWRSSRTFSKLVCALVASAGTYYAFFGTFLLLVAGMFASVRAKHFRPLFNSAVLSSVIIIVSFFNIIPNIFYITQHGLNPAPLRRAPVSAEFFGLKVPVMLLPVTGHRVPGLARLKETYKTQTLATNENDFATLGVVGTLGFLLSIVSSVHPVSRSEASQLLLNTIGVITLFALLLAITNGFSTLVAFVIPIIRSYNRMSVYIAFLSFLALGTIADVLRRKYQHDKRKGLALLTALGVVLLVGILDETTPNFVPSYRQLKTAYLADTKFFTRIEAAVPKDTMIFELPYAGFPENDPVHQMWAYEELRGYLHSNSLRWSYPAMQGRSANAWLEHVAAMPPQQMVETLAFAGFGGVYVDRYGFQDHAVSLIEQLTHSLHARPIENEDGRLVFLSMQRYTSELRKRYSPQLWRLRQDAVLSPLRPRRGAGN